MIEVEHVTKRYGDRVAVDDLSFRVRPGIVTGFLGPNGAGEVHDDADDALAEQIVLEELTPQRASLEQAFMSLTGSSVEYRTGAPSPAAGDELAVAA